jgi:hypothetical protein
LLEDNGAGPRSSASEAADERDATVLNSVTTRGRR